MEEITDRRENGIPAAGAGGSQDLCLRRHTVQSSPYRECPSGGDLGCDLPLSEAYRL